MRIPSTVFANASALEFGAERSSLNESTAYESLKMRTASEASLNSKYYFGPAVPLPAEFSASDLATLTVWFLVSEGHRAVERYAQNLQGIRLGMTMGIPMAFFDHNVLQRCFLSIARRAWILYREEGLLDRTIPIQRARQLLDKHPSAEIPETPADEVRDWLRSEGEAAMWWPFQSPAVSPGPYAKIDIGAGTSHASLYRIYGTPETPKAGMAFFGAFSVPIGMDKIDQALAGCVGADEDCLTLRGREQSILANNGTANAAVRPVREEIYEAYRRAWMQTYYKIQSSVSEIQAWRGHSIFMIGGGSLVPLVADPLRIHPADSSLEVKLATIEPPPDLQRADGQRVSSGDLPFVGVAYGLANLGLSIPEALTPAQVGTLPVSPTRRVQLDRDDIYAK